MSARWVSFELDVNGEVRRLKVPENRTLLRVLRDDLRLTGTKQGCGIGRCGSCTVLIDDKPRRACNTPIRKVRGSRILTIEGLGDGAGLDAIQQAFLDHFAVQCGFCTPGMIMAAKGLLLSNPQPTRDAIRTALSSNLCRCTGYLQIFEAIEAAADRMSA